MRHFRSRNSGASTALVLIAGLSLSLAGCSTARTIPPTTTFWQKLGIPQAIGGARDNRLNRRGNNPQRERKPPLKRIADPANLEAENPAIKAAAEIKAEEDLAPQKIKALKYLVDIGCGCYDKDGKVEAALMAGLDDCTEDVRLAAIETITELAQTCDPDAAYGGGDNSKKCEWFGSGHNPLCKLLGDKDKRQQKRASRKSGGGKSGCSRCCGNCCTAKIQERLAQMAYEEKCGCWLEPSAEVRAKAKEALSACPCPQVDCEEEKKKEDGEKPEPLPKPKPVDPEAQSGDDETRDGEGAEATDRDADENHGDATTLLLQPNALGRAEGQVPERSATAHASFLPSMIRRIAHDIPFVSDQREADDSAPEFQRKDWQGVVEFLDPSNGAALVVLKGGVSAPEGERLNCLVPADDGQTMLSFPCRVVHARPGMIGLEPLNQFGQSRLRPGVKLVVRRNEPLELPHPQQETLSQQETPSEEPNGSEIMSISAETDAAATSWLNPFRQ